MLVAPEPFSGYAARIHVSSVVRPPKSVAEQLEWYLSEVKRLSRNGLLEIREKQKETIRGDRSRNVELTFSCGGLNRNWIAYTGNLINTTTEQAWPFEVEFEYWSGPGWSEGSRSASVVLGAIPDGDYKLVLMPYTGLPTVQARRARGQVTVRRNVMLWRYVVLIFLLLLVVPAFVGFRYAVFESSRWADSDFGGG